MKTTERLTPEQAIRLYNGDFHQLIRLADDMAHRLHPGRIGTYIIERNINYTNVCTCRCSFCAFSVSPGPSGGFVITHERLAEKIRELYAIGGRQILLQGGLNPELGLDWHVEMLRFLRFEFPDLHIHAYSPPEINFIARNAQLSVEKLLDILMEAGLNSIPGGGAEILADRVRHLVAPAKGEAQMWLEVMRCAHRQGLSTTATMMFGHLETIEERIEHLDRLRRVQDESLARREEAGRGGVFTSFTCWPFQPGGTRLARRHNITAAGAVEQLKMTALSRLYLDNIHNHQASWVTQGPQIGQLQLRCGCNDMGSLMMEENVVAAAGTTYRLRLEELTDLIRAAGFTPRQRDFYYRCLEDNSSNVK